jgi:hypothetical protein
MINIPSIVVVTSIENIHSHTEEFIHFFNNIHSDKKDLVIFSSHPVSDDTSIRKISANEIIILYPNDFFLFNFILKPKIIQSLRRKHYAVAVHFNTGPHLRNTWLITKNILSPLKISHHLSHSKTFSVVLYDSNNYLSDLLYHLEKIKSG